MTNYTRDNLPDISTWELPDGFCHDRYHFILGELNDVSARALITEALASGANPYLHTPEYRLALQHALALALQDELCPF